MYWCVLGQKNIHAIISYNTSEHTSYLASNITFILLLMQKATLLPKSLPKVSFQIHQLKKHISPIDPRRSIPDLDLHLHTITENLLWSQSCCTTGICTLQYTSQNIIGSLIPSRATLILMQARAPIRLFCITAISNCVCLN